MSDRMLISHEWIETTGGSEAVFRRLLSVFPDADGACLWNNMPGSFDRPIRESWLASSPLRGHKAVSLPAHASAWKRMDLSNVHTVLASSHAFGHQLATRAVRLGKLGFAYVHSPARYLWAPEVEPRGQGAVIRGAALPLKSLDRRLTDPRVSYAANSEYIRDRIRRAWHVDSTVIYPPVDVERIRAVPDWTTELTSPEADLIATLPPKGFVLGASRLVSYKRLDQVIDVGSELNMPVVIAGAGPDERALRAHAETSKVPVKFLGRVSDAMLYALYQRTALFVFLAIEDFGIMPVEATAAGSAVLVNVMGGAAETVRATGGGLAVDGTAPAGELARAAEAAMLVSRDGAIERCGIFSGAAFRANVENWVTSGESHA